jgi:hypothetical protein
MTDEAFEKEVGKHKSDLRSANNEKTQLSMLLQFVRQ